MLEYDRTGQDRRRKEKYRISSVRMLEYDMTGQHWAKKDKNKKALNIQHLYLMLNVYITFNA